jgi:hypothetical protein
LIVSMSFGEFMFLAGFTQKTAKEDLNIKRDRGIISCLLRRNVLEDTTPRQGTRPCQAGCSACHGGKHPRASRVFLHRLLGCIFTVPQVDLIQELVFNPQGYKYRVAPLPSSQVRS